MRERKSLGFLRPKSEKKNPIPVLQAPKHPHLPPLGTQEPQHRSPTNLTKRYAASGNDVLPHCCLAGTEEIEEEENPVSC